MVPTGVRFICQSGVLLCFAISISIAISCEASRIHFQHLPIAAIEAIRSWRQTNHDDSTFGCYDLAENACLALHHNNLDRNEEQHDESANHLIIQAATVTIIALAFLVWLYKI